MLTMRKRPSSSWAGASVLNAIGAPRLLRGESKPRLLGGVNKVRPVKADEAQVKSVEGV